VRSFEESLERVLDPNGYYWRYPGDEDDDPKRTRLVELRIDVPLESTGQAMARMNAGGWSLETSPDGDDDPVCRLYFRRTQTLTVGAKSEMLTEALRVASDCNGTLMSWINVEGFED
jgi:hypothetical protein